MRCQRCGIPTMGAPLCWTCEHSNRQPTRASRVPIKTPKPRGAPRVKIPDVDPVWERQLEEHRQQVDRAIRERGF